MNVETPSSISARMKRISGQVAGIQRMIDDDRYCMDVLNQISAVRSALDAVGIELVTNHIERCVLGHGGHSTRAEQEQSKAMTSDELLIELRTALSRFLK